MESNRARSDGGACSKIFRRWPATSASTIEKVWPGAVTAATASSKLIAMKFPLLIGSRDVTGRS